MSFQKMVTLDLLRLVPLLLLHGVPKASWAVGSRYFTVYGKLCQLYIEVRSGSDVGDDEAPLEKRRGARLGW
ncbi:hypothetical protein ACFX10_004180 [Malus domestica]